MTKIRKKIGTIPINDIEQQVQQATSDAIAQMQQDVSDFIDEETAQYPEIGGAFKFQEDPEERSEITTDSEGKIISYRDSDGVKHEKVGVNTKQIIADSIILPNDALEQSYQYDKNHTVEKNWYLPKFGKVNIKEETFYLTADSRWSTKDDVVCIQIYDDTDANAAQRLTLSYYYIKSTLTPLAGGGYDRTSVNENSVRLDLFPGKEIGQTFGVGSDDKIYYTDEVTKINNVYYVTSTLVDGEVVPESIVVTESQTKEYYVRKLQQVDGVWYLKSTLEINSGAAQQVDYKNETINGKAVIKVNPVTDIPPYKAWCVNKKPEHYCIADIDFGTFYRDKNGNYPAKNIPISIKYQGSSSTAHRKRGLRITFYKKNDYKKKDKVKIGEMVRLSGYNMKAYYTDISRVKDPILSNIFIEMWQTRGDKAYPWNAYSVVYNGATGMIKAFPIEEYFGDEFYGLAMFGLKKDEKNYMLDGDDDASGIFVSGNTNSPTMWQNANHTMWDDEMMDEMSQETADALDELFKYTKGFVNGTIEIDGKQVKFKNSMLEERIGLASWIDYWIGLQIFLLWDNTFHNIILYTGPDKKKFYPFFYDVDNSCDLNWNYDTDLIEACTNPEHHIHPYFVLDMSFWEKFISEYKDSIINRYAELRKTVLSNKNIEDVYKTCIASIPEYVVLMEQERWDTTARPSDFDKILKWIENRLNWLDETYFNL